MMKVTMLWLTLMAVGSGNAACVRGLPHNSESSRCKAFPGTSSWPSQATWAQLNQTLGGKLIAPAPPAAVCHEGHPTFSNSQCAVVTKEWETDTFHAEDPISSMWQQYNNDTCWPEPEAPCSSSGYPAYVINATTAVDVKQGIDFAQLHHVRIIVKSTGHDYLGRSQAPGSLSIWVHHMQDLQTHNSFRPKGCDFIIESTATTIGGGSQIGAVVEALDELNQTIVGGTSKTVSIGGYLTGGGHSVLAHKYGLGADQALEMELVTPKGDIVTANECQNQDLFWAMRGGGGSTFGVMTSVTLITYPTPKVVAANLAIGSLDLSAPWVWDLNGYILSQFPYLDSQGVSGYSVLSSNYSVPDGSNNNITVQIAGIAGEFLILDSENTDEIQAIWDPIIAHVKATWPDAVALVDLIPYPSFASWLDVYYDQDPTGYNEWVSSHLLDEDALTSNRTAVGQAFKAFRGQAFLVSGNGTRNAKPRGGSNAVNPSWRRAYVHATTGKSFLPFNATAKYETLGLVNEMTESLRQLAPNMGSYQNENNPGEPNWTKSFWGDNYKRLLQIKRTVDPEDVFWCDPCVGNDRWETRGYQLCPVIRN
ncbi:FAD-binding domain-containing protein [Astrocystis sublimbata]|nr:FAD-binding domain-containing protein [Astrocystis sublimbata]